MCVYFFHLNKVLNFIPLGRKLSFFKYLVVFFILSIAVWQLYILCSTWVKRWWWVNSPAWGIGFVMAIPYECQSFQMSHSESTGWKCRAHTGSLPFWWMFWKVSRCCGWLEETFRVRVYTVQRCPPANQPRLPRHWPGTTGLAYAPRAWAPSSVGIACNEQPLWGEPFELL